VSQARRAGAIGRLRVGTAGMVAVAMAAACGTPPARSGPPVEQARSASPPDASPPAPPERHLFPPQDLGLLDAPDRAEWQKPDLIMDTLGIAEGSIVADLGAGGGWFTVYLARRVGPNGMVYAEDIQPLMIEAINRRVAREGLRNVHTILGAPNDPRLPSGLDAVLIVDSFPEIHDPVPLLRNVARALRPHGRLGVVDFLPGGGGPGPAPEERVTPDAVVTAASAAGLQVTTRETVPPFLFLLVFTPAGPPLSGAP
jgi:SAM-dependent methyltransferase